jgi:hypothetical protein
MARAKVLVVDDERKIRDLVTLYLERDGYQVLQATSWWGWLTPGAGAPSAGPESRRPDRGSGLGRPAASRRRRRNPGDRAGMTRFYVEFSVPVIAIVEDGKVVRVAVSDEEIKLTKERVAAYDTRWR